VFVNLFNGQRDYVWTETTMRLRPKVKELLPKIAEAIISIEIDSLERRYYRKSGRPPLSMFLVLESILFVLTEGCSWRAIDRP